MRTGRIFWFIIAALCVAAAVIIFARRSMLAESLHDPMYRALIITAYLLLTGAAGSLTKAFSAGLGGPALHPKVKDGATYTVVERSHAASGQRSHYWLGDNGQEMELTDDEAALLP